MYISVDVRATLCSLHSKIARALNAVHLKVARALKTAVLRQRDNANGLAPMGNANDCLSNGMFCHFRRF